MPSHTRPSVKPPGKPPAKPSRKAPARKPAKTPSKPEPKADAKPEPKADPIPALPPARPAPASGLPGRLVELFQLSETEQRIVQLLLAAPASLSVAELAQQTGQELAAVISLFGSDGKLRTRGLAEVKDEASLGWPLPSDAVQCGRGLHLWLAAPVKDESLLFSGQAPGVTYIPAPSHEAAWARELLGDKPAGPVAELVREHLGVAHAVLLWLGGCGGEQVPALVQATRSRLQRPVLWIDGAALAGWPMAQLGAALRRLRRDADLRGAAVVVSDVKQLGGAWRALCHPRPVGQSAPVVLCSGDALSPLGRLPVATGSEAALGPVVAALGRAAGPAAPTVVVAPDGTVENEDPAVLASREDARRRAALDAARAMGRPIPPEFAEAPPPIAPPAARPAAAPPPAAPAPTPAPAPAPAPAYRPPAPSSAAGDSDDPPPAARPMNPRLAAALAKAGLPPAGSADYQSGQHARRPAAAAAPAPTAPPPAPAAPPPVAAAPAPAAATAPTAPSGSAAPTQAASAEDDQPPLPIDESAAMDEVLRVARTTPNNAQREQLLRKLAGTKSPAVIQMFRQSLTSAHAGVRAAAEAGMASLFGANWNRSRPIAPPVQPPRSDDGGRGPGGAF